MNKSYAEETRMFFYIAFTVLVILKMINQPTLVCYTDRL
jgi:hypothetical protein